MSAPAPRPSVEGHRAVSLVIPLGYTGFMAMTLRLTDGESAALKARADLEQRSMQEVAREAVRSYIEDRSRVELLDRVLDQELPRYDEALRRLGE